MTWKSWKMPKNAHPPAKPEVYGEQAKEYLGGLLKKTGLEIKPPSNKTDTLLAHVGGKIALKEGLFEEYHLRMFEALWKHDQNIEDEKVLNSIAEELGLNTQFFEQMLHHSDYHAQVESDFTLCDKFDIWTIPSYMGSKR